MIRIMNENDGDQMTNADVSKPIQRITNIEMMYKKDRERKNGSTLFSEYINDSNKW